MMSNSGKARHAIIILAVLAAAGLLGAAFLAVTGCFGGQATEAVNAGAGADTQADTTDSGPTCGLQEGTVTEPGDSTPVRPFEPLAMPAAFPSPAVSLDVPILMFHHVGDPPEGADSIRTGLTVPASDFDAMMSWLKQQGYCTVTEADLFQSLYYGKPLPPKPVMLTFDDGYDDQYEIARPILEKYGFTATFYIISGKVGKPEYMGWNEIQALDRQGMDIGSHSIDHLDLKTLSAGQLSSEVVESQAAIASQIGHPVYWFCYPAGSYDQDTLKALRSAGYLLATTTKPGETQSSDAPLELRRYRIGNSTGLAGFQQLVLP